MYKFHSRASQDGLSVGSDRRFDSVGQTLGVRLNLILTLAFDHYARQRLSAGIAQKQPATFAQFSLYFSSHVANGLDIVERLSFADPHINPRTCGYRSKPVVNCSRLRFCSRMARSRLRVVIMPSPARLKRGKIRCPDCSPPRLAPERSSSSSTYLSPTSVRLSSSRACEVQFPDRRYS